MGRAIVREPAAFLMDEPLSNLDAKLRVQMRAEIAGLQRDLGVTTIYVTHDQVEAMTMGDRVAVMRKGELQQVADPQTLYDRPVNLFVGGFIGSPAMNMLEATLERQNGGLVAKIGDQTLALDAGDARRPGRASPRTTGKHGRPRHPAGGSRGRGARRPTRPPIARLQRHGRADARRSARRSWCTSRSRRRHAVTEDVRELAEDVGDERAVERAGRRATRRRSSAASARARACAQGEAVEVAVDTRALHFFDPETGLGIYDGTAAARKEHA